ncbi:l-serine dehydratase/L-threonine deaminase-like [Achlya hypogyna]|uniref:L-serine ammonia-lyase n=1 Tax=Achlya hypogyna TaxID=1202772 RepID=A0A1V9ZKE6_ACHHY|nr:l-serine dehydratase/L-threonine deaminase-like [Achlya hypogyna]
MPLHIVTPAIESRVLSHLAKKKVYLKLDNCQPSGSFKMRGVGLACQRAIERGASHLIASSGGNAGLAVACSAQKLGVPATVFVPESTPAYMRARLEIEGVTVKVAGKVWLEAHEAAKAFQDASGDEVAYIPPFDHPDIIDGHSSVIAELQEQIPQPDLLVVAVGGGGYFSGISHGLQKYGWTNTKLLSMETHGANKLERSVAEGRRVTLSRIDTIARSLGASAVSETAFAFAQQQRIHASSVSDDDAVAACLHFASDHKFLVEPACGATLAPIYSGKLQAILGDDWDKVESICLMICGGWMSDVPPSMHAALAPAFA